MAHKHFHRSLHDRRDVYGDARFVNMELINNDRPPPPPPAPPPLPLPANDIRVQNQANRQATEAEMRTVIETIYKTLDPTFSGPIGGYVTLSEDARPPASAAPSPASDRKLARIDSKSSDAVVARPSPTTETPSTAEATSSIEAALATLTSTLTSEDGSLSSSSKMAESSPSALSSPTLSPTPTPSPVPSPTPTATPHAAADLSRGKKAGDHGGGDKGGSPVGPKVGIAFGVIGGIVAVGLIAFFLLKRRRKQAAKGYKLEDEKSRKGFGAISNPFESSSRDNPGAPRISLRPVTQFLPNWNGLEKRTSRGPMAAAAAAAAASASAPLGSSWDRSINNPFDSVPSTIAEEQSVRSFSTSSGSISGTSNPFAGGPDAGSHHHHPSRPSGPSGSVDLSRKWGPGPSSPTGTDYSLTSVSSEMAAAGGPPVSSVHRVQLDFKPTLDDEMELRIGELIRVFHEYDDGWCLVSRLDRSQQGVVPRTCLSTRPVKPRQPQGVMPRMGPPVNPTGPGRGPNQTRAQGQGPARMGPPGGNFGRPPSPPGAQSFRSGPGPTVLNSGPPTNRQGPLKPRYRVSPPGPPPNYAPMGPVSRKPVPGG
ncbi:hypothetical protein L249_4136 [Ophiocordyceps polyrhachis-furcata BCC 54312]|uniref:SH3 domain-containing protein n=1 Tax=Ophiocordyceps polyrhachis-furcata BCC 54312 TaxID=1330021 RepID=A0A367L5P4_9HYPO|nr:hypothetical protein L249_4136 [Ophiocordyceps polyrhachis-furcata BCC 54312]